ncbi:hypothetical protein JCM9140_1741 [Halalkalibacter wakoensis JCM 9140]|uniref:DUF4190 domain-containing protein n=1 Tax=Halalkalibacter wakoensis JCM 9140 TaxID=1236970 RepID=W4Q1W4_9BACI|nr:DUF4190 domain-containing protein [Halalkalibacter wakoensis]GAE25733.1 hypothetical protein JCM9140_1741 [Halalkalibacter wakoensis JCM 9140]
MTDKRKTNILAVTSLIVGILSILLTAMGIVLGIVGIVLSVIANKQIKKANENGERLAKTGMFCSIAGVCLQLLFIVVGIVTVFSTPVG